MEALGPLADSAQTLGPAAVTWHRAPWGQVAAGRPRPGPVLLQVCPCNPVLGTPRHTHSPGHGDGGVSLLLRRWDAVNRGAQRESSPWKGVLGTPASASRIRVSVEPSGRAGRSRSAGQGEGNGPLVPLQPAGQLPCCHGSAQERGKALALGASSRAPLGLRSWLHPEVVKAERGEILLVSLGV